MTYNKSNHEYKIHDTILRKRVHKDRRQDILDKEDILYILNDNRKLKDCREYYADGLGMRGFDKLSKSNFRIMNYNSLNGGAFNINGGNVIIDECIIKDNSDESI